MSINMVSGIPNIMYQLTKLKRVISKANKDIDTDGFCLDVDVLISRINRLYIGVDNGNIDDTVEIIDTINQCLFDMITVKENYKTYKKAYFEFTYIINDIKRLMDN